MVKERIQPERLVEMSLKLMVRDVLTVTVTESDSGGGGDYLVPDN